MQKYLVFVKDEVCLRYATSKVVVARGEKQAICAVLIAMYGEAIARVFAGMRLNAALEHFKALGIEINCKN